MAKAKAKAKAGQSVGAKVITAAKSTAKAVIQKAGQSVGVKGETKKGSGKRRSRVTPEKLQKKILILKLQKKLSRLKYGGR